LDGKRTAAESAGGKVRGTPKKKKIKQKKSIFNYFTEFQCFKNFASLLVKNLFNT